MPLLPAAGPGPVIGTWWPDPGKTWLAAGGFIVFASAPAKPWDLVCSKKSRFYFAGWSAVQLNGFFANRFPWIIETGRPFVTCAAPATVRLACDLTGTHVD